MNYGQLRNEIIEPSLRKLINPYDTKHSCATPIEINLVTATIVHESDCGNYVRQVGGPALGICQMEPQTFYYHWEYLERERDKYQNLKGEGIEDSDNEHLPWYTVWNCVANNIIVGKIADPEALKWNLSLAVVMCRIHYLRHPEPLPENDLDSIAEYWYDYYNQGPEERRDEWIRNFKSDAQIVF